MGKNLEALHLHTTPNFEMRILPHLYCAFNSSKITKKFLVLPRPMPGDAPGQLLVDLSRRVANGAPWPHFDTAIHPQSTLL